jgi:hypothetical protein
MRKNSVMDEGQFVLVVDGNDGHTAEHLEEALRQLGEDLWELDEVQVSEPPPDRVVAGTRSGMIADLPVALVIVWFAAKPFMPNLRKIGKNARKAGKGAVRLSEDIKKASEDIKKASENLAEAVRNVGEAGDTVLPEIANTIADWQKRHPGIRVMARFRNDSQVDLTGRSAPQMIHALRAGMATTGAESAVSEAPNPSHE